MALIIPNSFASKTSAQLSDLDENFTYLKTQIDPYVDNILVGETGVVTIGAGVVANVTGNLTGNVTGNADTVTNGVYTIGNQTIGGVKTFSSNILGNLTGNVTGNLSGNISTSTSVTGDLYVSGVSNIKIPFYKVYMDEASRTTPSSFAKTYTGSYVSYGDIILGFSPAGTKSHLYEMTVNAPTNTTVTQRVWQTDDASYYWLNGSQIGTVASGNLGTTITWNLVTGDNLIQILVNNSGGGNYGLQVMGDFFIRYPDLRFKL